MELRTASPGDDHQIIALLRTTMGWGNDPRFDDLYHWKHRQNPFGSSPTWVAVDGGRLVGVRLFMRWEFIYQGRIARAARAVDTAVHPDFQGRGLFTALTLRGLEQLESEGVEFIFNTPNDKSRPGYLKMGWEEVGHLPAAVSPRSVRSLFRMVRSRVPASHWSNITTTDIPFSDWLSGLPSVTLASSALDVASTRSITTHRTSAFLRWRYSLRHLHYRARALPDAEGCLVYRCRTRGAARELVIADLIGQGETNGSLIRQLLRDTSCDYALEVARGSVRAGSVGIPGGGPILTWRGLRSVDPPPLRAWGLTMGDVELF